MAATYVAAPPPPADSMHVYDSTMVREMNAFNNNMNLGAGTSIAFVQQEIRWSSVVAVAPQDHWPYHGLCIGYGLTGDSMRFTLGFMRMDSTTTPGYFTYHAPDSVFDLWNGQLNKWSTEQWSAQYQYDPKNPAVYFSRARIRHRSTSSFVPVDRNTDPHMETMAWEAEVMRMYDENQTGHRDSTMYLVIDCIARPDAKGDLRHNVCCHLRLRPTAQAGSGYRDLIDNSYDARAMLRMHGCDQGSLCPEECDAYIQPPR